jgi:hypothetical protein
MTLINMLLLKDKNKLFTRFFTFLPPILGISVFTYIVKYSGIPSVHDRIPTFQGIIAFFSLILLGFTYIRNRRNIFGIKIIPVLIFVLLFPILFFIYQGAAVIFTILFVLIQFFTLMISYISIVKGNIDKFLLLGCINSVFMPFCLILDGVWLFFVCVLLFVLFYFMLSKIINQLGNFNFSETGLDFFKSIMIQSPLILLPFFDYRIAELISAENYSNYVLYYKYINGFVTLVFSFKQLNLSFSGNLSKNQLIKSQLIFIFIGLIICSLFESFYAFVFSILLYSLGVNLSSLKIRKALLDGLSIKVSIIGLVSVLLYTILIFNFGNLITLSNSTFVNFMFFASFFTALFTDFLKSTKTT